MLYVAAFKNYIVEMYTIGRQRRFFYLKSEYIYKDKQENIWEGVYQNVVPVGNNITVRSVVLWLSFGLFYLLISHF